MDAWGDPDTLKGNKYAWYLNVCMSLFLNRAQLQPTKDFQAARTSEKLSPIQ